MCVIWLEEGEREGRGGKGQIDGDDHCLPPSPTTGQSNHRQLCCPPLFVTRAFMNVSNRFCLSVLCLRIGTKGIFSVRLECIYQTEFHKNGCYIVKQIIHGELG